MNLTVLSQLVSLFLILSLGPAVLAYFSYKRLT